MGWFIDLTNIHPMSPPLDLARLRKISLTLKVSPRSRQPPLTEVTAGPHSILSQAMLWFTKFTFRKSSKHPLNQSRYFSPTACIPPRTFCCPHPFVTSRPFCDRRRALSWSSKSRSRLQRDQPWTTGNCLWSSNAPTRCIGGLFLKIPVWVSVRHFLDVQS